MSKTQNRVSVRNRFRSAMAHRPIADLILDALKEMQTGLNSVLLKLQTDADHPVLAEITNVTMQDVGSFFDVTGAAKYWGLHDGGNAAHYVWYNVTNGSNVQTDPAPGGTGHQVNILSADTAAQIATKTAAILNPLSQFDATSLLAVVTVTNSTAGVAIDATVNTAHVAISITQQGSASVSAIDTNFVSTQSLSGVYAVLPDVAVVGPSLATPRQVMISATTHHTLGSRLVDAVADMQSKYGALLVKLDAQSGTLASTNFASTLAVSAIDPSAALSPAQDTESARTIMRSAMSNESLGDQIIDAIASSQASYNATLAQLDTGSTLALSTNYAVSVIDPNSLN